MELLNKFYSEIAEEVNNVRNNITSFKNLKQAFVILLGIYVFSTLSLIRADVPFRDDMARKIFGYAGWENFSRYLSNFLSAILHTSYYHGDISPLPQYLAMLIIVIASIIVIISLKTEKTISIWDILAVIPLGLSPYFLECLSYKYDSPYMALSVLCSVMPILFYNSKRDIYLFSIVIGILISCNTYQVSLGVFPMIVVFVSVKAFLENKAPKVILKKILVSALAWIFTILFYKIFIVQPHPYDSYVNSDIFAFNGLLSGVLNNYQQYFHLIFEDFEPIYKIIIAYLYMCYVVQITFSSQKNKMVSFLLAFSALAVSTLLMFGPYVVFTKPLFEVRAMYGVGVCLALVAVTCVNIHSTKVSKVAVSCLAWCFMVFTFLYGNALKEQDRYIHFRMEQTISSLSDIDDFQRGKSKIIQFVGTYGRSPVIENMPHSKYILGRLIPDITSSVQLGTFYFYHYYGLDKVEQVLEDGEHILGDGNRSETRLDIKQHNLPLVKETYYEKIYHQGNEWLVELK